MKRCPKCNEILGYYATSCFKCGFDFSGRRHNNPEEKMNLEIAIRSLGVLDKRDEDIARLRKQTNDRFEYAVEIITDSDDGGTDFNTLIKTLNKYSNQGWRLVNTFTNELGETSHIEGGTRYNSTIDQVVLIFERRVITSEEYISRINKGIDPFLEENEINRKVSDEINHIRATVQTEYLQHGTVVSGSGKRELILSVIESSDKNLTAQEISAALGNQYDVMEILTYLQKMIEEGSVQREGNTYIAAKEFKIDLRK